MVTIETSESGSFLHHRKTMFKRNVQKAWLPLLLDLWTQKLVFQDFLLKAHLRTTCGHLGNHVNTRFPWRLLMWCLLLFYIFLRWKTALTFIVYGCFVLNVQKVLFFYTQLLHGQAWIQVALWFVFQSKINVIKFVYTCKRMYSNSK